MLYVVVNADNSIHTVEGKPLEVLSKGMTRHEIDIDKLPDNFSNSHYEFKNKDLVKKKDFEIEEFNESWNKSQRLQIKIESKMKMLAIESLELEDQDEDYSEEKAKLLKNIENNKKNKKKNIKE